MIVGPVRIPRFRNDNRAGPRWFFAVSMAWLALLSFFPCVGVAAETADGAAPTPRRAAVLPAGDADPKRMAWDRDYLKGYLRDTGKILGAPARWDGKDWLTASLVVAAAAGFYAYDRDIQEWFQDKRGDASNNVAKAISPLGKPLFAVPAMGLVYLYGESRENEKARRIGLLGMESTVLAGAFTSVLKFATHRSRPDTGEGYDKWRGPEFSTDNMSFPSLHTSTAFSLAKVIAAETDNPCVTAAAYSLASLVGLARLNDNEHWASDGFLGAAIGYFTAVAVLAYHKRPYPVSFTPSVSRLGGGVSLTYHY
ncbi:MAG: phosphatase PAP2 family protein [Pseudomonadota bacterium]|nr:phosphatase PAP2 family protein [Pseudomonadota bacterium]